MFPDSELPQLSGGPDAAGLPHTPPVLVVGMGASAGGIEAFSRFFDAMPADSGAAFVLVLHLDPTRESQMAHVLSAHTLMPVVQVEDGMVIAPNAVYVIAPDWSLTVTDGVLHLTKPAEKRGHRHPVDVMFRSLAADQGERAIAIVLSGTGSNGTDGLKEIRAGGGLILVQDPATAKFDGMPQSAIAAGMADHILAPEQMPAVLQRYLHNAYIAAPEGGETAATIAQPLIDQVLAALRTHTGHNFNNYRRSTLQRRIQRRLGLSNIASLKDYLTVLRASATEAPLLVKDLLINVTSFFRDAEAWKTLSDVAIAPMIAARENGATIRAWVPACSTGEEAYTVAMLIAEHAGRAGKEFDVKIFATDAREDNLVIARDGTYPVAAVAGLDATRQRRFFEQGEATVRIRKDLRNTVVFAQQNLLRDPPFSHLDLITCRNLLIYLEPEAQQGIIALFHFALDQGATLLLGNTETVGRHDAVFTPLSKKWRIYRRLGPTRLDLASFPLQHSGGHIAKHDEPIPAQSRPDAPLATADFARRALVDRFAPAAVLIDRAGAVIYFHGATSPYLAQPSGEPVRDLFAMTRDGLVIKLRAAVRLAALENREVSFVGAVRQTGQRQPVQVTVAPVLDRGKASGLLMVSFVPSAVAPLVSGETPISPAEESMLHDELLAVRAELQNTIENLETANEELKASNEEATSMNEELQSTNEELETSKEEMQSFNEELHTVNSQLQHKIRELEDSTNDLNNLLAGTETATLFIDSALCIKWFAPGTQELFDLRSSDIGRPLDHFSRKFDDENLLPDAAKVLRNLAVIEALVTGPTGRWYMRRMLPYRTLDNRIAGVVITFLDMTDSKKAHDAEDEARIYAQTIIETMRQPLLVLDNALKVVSANPAFRALFGVSVAETTGVVVYDLGNGQWDFPKLRELLDEVLSKNQQFNDVEIEHEFIRLGHRCMLVNGRKLTREGGRASLILLAIEDITERKAAEATAIQLATIVGSSTDAITSIDLNGIATSWNPGATRLFGYEAGEVLGKPLEFLHWQGDALPEGDSPDPESIQTDSLEYFHQGGATRHHETQKRRKDGSPVWVSLTTSPLRNASGALLGASTIARDISERRRTEQHRETMVGELNHRVKNALAIVSAVASQTLTDGATLPAARAAFMARLQSMSRAHDLLVHGNWSGSDLASVIHATIAPHDIDRRFQISGPHVALKPALALTFSFAIHELCTNAIKYGALSVPDGRISIHWTGDGLGDNPRLTWLWAESGGPVVAKPGHRGFGSSLVERVLATAMEGAVTLTYAATGLICTLDSPWPTMAAARV